MNNTQDEIYTERARFSVKPDSGQDNETITYNLVKMHQIGLEMSHFEVKNSQNSGLIMESGMTDYRFWPVLISHKHQNGTIFMS